MKIVYLIGLPGSGKSSALARALTTLGYTTGVEHDQPVPHIDWRNGDNTISELGRRREAFSGTDALALNIQPKAVEWIRTAPALTVVAEGDRLANPSFFNVAIEAAQTFVVVHIDVPLDVARERARRRAEKLGRPEQNESWWRGRGTKVANLTAGFGPNLVRVDGQAQPKAVAEAVAGVLVD